MDKQDNEILKSSADEIDLRQLFWIFKSFLKRFLRLLFSGALFFRKKMILLLGMVLFGFGIGVLWDSLKPDTRVKQEVIVMPNFDSVAYLYEFVAIFNTSCNNKKEDTLNKKFSNSFIEVTVEPVVNYNDILNYHKELDGKTNSYNILEDLSEEINLNPKFIKQFKQHKLVFKYNNNEKSEEFSGTFINSFESNNYYNTKRKIVIKELNKVILENDKSINFINTFINRVAANEKLDSDKQSYFIGAENEIPTIASLLKEKNNLLEINTQIREQLALTNRLITLVSKGEIVPDSSIFSLKKFYFPILFFLTTVLFYFFKFFSKTTKHFISN